MFSNPQDGVGFKDLSWKFVFVENYLHSLLSFDLHRTKFCFNEF